MADVVFLAVVAAFFAVCVLFVKACAAIAGSGADEIVAERAAPPVAAVEDEVAA